MTGMNTIVKETAATTAPAIEKGTTMAERLVDVMNSNKTVLHTYPITIRAPNITPNDTEYKAKAMKAAAHAQLVPDANLNDLTTRMHVSRGGALAPYGDDRGMLSETKQGLDQVMRERNRPPKRRDGPV
jgi:hypothetical protein